MKFLLAAINAKYIHSNPAVYSLKAFAKEQRPKAQIEIGEYTINHQMDHILQDIYRRKPDFVAFPVIYGTFPMYWKLRETFTKSCRSVRSGWAVRRCPTMLPGF